MSGARKALFDLAKKLRSRAEWMHDGYYDSDATMARNDAVRTVLTEIAEDVEAVANDMEEGT